MDIISCSLILILLIWYTNTIHLERTQYHGLFLMKTHTFPFHKLGNGNLGNEKKGLLGD